MLSLLSLLACVDGAKPEDTAVVVDTGMVAPTAELSACGDFGAVVVGASATCTVTLANTGSGSLEIHGVTLADGAPFTVSAIGSVLVPPGASTSFDVTFAPTAVGTFLDEVVVDTNAGTEILDLSGEGIGPSLVADPADCDFGEVPVGCDASCEVTLVNEGTTVLAVDALEMTGAAFSLEDPEAAYGALPWSLAPLESVNVTVTFAPDEEGAFTGALFVGSDDPAGPVEVGLAGSGGDGRIEETFAIERRVDILFAVDPSDTLSDERADLWDAWGAFFDALDAAGADWRLGVVDPGDGCMLGGDWIDTTLTRDEQLAALDAVEADVIGSGFGLATLEDALSATGSGACNENFYRGYRLALVGVTDGADASANPWSYYVPVFQAFVADPDDVAVHAIAGDYPTGCGSVEPGAGWYEASVATGGQFLSVCTGDWGGTLETLATSMEPEFDTPFELSGWPVEGTIVVYVDGVEVDGWTYARTDNNVEIDPAPESGSTVTISYVPADACSD